MDDPNRQPPLHHDNNDNDKDNDKKPKKKKRSRSQVDRSDTTNHHNNHSTRSKRALTTTTATTATEAAQSHQLPVTEVVAFDPASNVKRPKAPPTPPKALIRLLQSHKSVLTYFQSLQENLNADVTIWKTRAMYYQTELEKLQQQQKEQQKEDKRHASDKDNNNNKKKNKKKEEDRKQAPVAKATATTTRTGDTTTATATTKTTKERDNNSNNNNNNNPMDNNSDNDQTSPLSENVIVKESMDLEEEEEEEHDDLDLDVVEPTNTTTNTTNTTKTSSTTSKVNSKAANIHVAKEETKKSIPTTTKTHQFFGFEIMSSSDSDSDSDDNDNNNNSENDADANKRPNDMHQINQTNANDNSPKNTGTSTLEAQPIDDSMLLNLDSSCSSSSSSNSSNSSCSSSSSTNNNNKDKSNDDKKRDFDLDGAKDSTTRKQQHQERIEFISNQLVQAYHVLDQLGVRLVDQVNREEEIDNNDKNDNNIDEPTTFIVTDDRHNETHTTMSKDSDRYNEHGSTTMDTPLNDLPNTATTTTRTKDIKFQRRTDAQVVSDLNKAIGRLCTTNPMQQQQQQQGKTISHGDLEAWVPWCNPKSTNTSSSSSSAAATTTTHEHELHPAMIGKHWMVRILIILDCYCSPNLSTATWDSYFCCDNNDKLRMKIGLFGRQDVVRLFLLAKQQEIRGWPSQDRSFVQQQQQQQQTQQYTSESDSIDSDNDDKNDLETNETTASKKCHSILIKWGVRRSFVAQVVVAVLLAKKETKQALALVWDYLLQSMPTSTATLLLFPPDNHTNRWYSAAATTTTTTTTVLPPPQPQPPTLPTISLIVVEALLLEADRSLDYCWKKPENVLLTTNWLQHFVQTRQRDPSDLNNIHNSNANANTNANTNAIPTATNNESARRSLCIVSIIRCSLLVAANQWATTKEYLVDRFDNHNSTSGRSTTSTSTSTNLQKGPREYVIATIEWACYHRLRWTKEKNHIQKASASASPSASLELAQWRPQQVLEQLQQEEVERLLNQVALVDIGSSQMDPDITIHSLALAFMMLFLSISDIHTAEYQRSTPADRDCDRDKSQSMVWLDSYIARMTSGSTTGVASASIPIPEQDALPSISASQLHYVLVGASVALRHLELRNSALMLAAVGRHHRQESSAYPHGQHQQQHQQQQQQQYQFPQATSLLRKTLCTVLGMDAKNNDVRAHVEAEMNPDPQWNRSDRIIVLTGCLKAAANVADGEMAIAIVNHVIEHQNLFLTNSEGNSRAQNELLDTMMDVARLPTIRVITLQRRVDRWRTMTLQALQHGLLAIKAIATIPEDTSLQEHFEFGQFAIDGQGRLADATNRLAGAVGGSATKLNQKYVADVWRPHDLKPFDRGAPNHEQLVRMSSTERACALSHIASWKGVWRSTRITIEQEREAVPDTAHASLIRHPEHVLRAFKICGFAEGPALLASNESMPPPPVCVILEDDAILVDNFAEKLANVLKELPRDFHFLSLGYSRPPSAPIVPFKKHVGIPTMLWYLTGYILSPSGAKYLLDSLPVVGPVDSWIGLKMTTNWDNVFGAALGVGVHAKPHAPTPSRKDLAHILHFRAFCAVPPLCSQRVGTTGTKNTSWKSKQGNTRGWRQRDTDIEYSGSGPIVQL